MDRDRFDALARLLATSGSRRVTLGALLGMMLGPAATAEVGARKRGQGIDRGQDKDQTRNRDRERRPDPRLQAEARGKGRKGRKKKRGGRGNDGGQTPQPSPDCCGTRSCAAPEPGSTRSECDFAGRSFAGQELDGSTFRGIDGRGANFNTTDNRGSIFAEACLQGASFRRAKLDGSTWGDACLFDADFTGAELDDDPLFAEALFCGTRMPDGSVNDRDCGRATPCCQARPDPACQRDADCIQSACIAGVCQGGTCVYTQVNNGPSPNDQCPVFCCGGECCPGNDPETTCNPAGLCCAPNCAGKACGPDGCGGDGTCGDCDDGLTCNGAGQCVCTPQSCRDGCCDGDTCRPGDTNQACGDGGAACAPCGAGQSCQNQRCAACAPQCTGKQCGPDGCGRSCGNCPDGQRCQNGECICDAVSCPDGCCANGPGNSGVCRSGSNRQACGTGGERCAACPAGQDCLGRRCAVCSPQTCPDGCCAANGTCQPGDAFGACGGPGGGPCASCNDSQTCLDRQCVGCGQGCMCTGQSVCIDENAPNTVCSARSDSQLCFCYVSRTGRPICGGTVSFSDCTSDAECGAGGACVASTGPGPCGGNGNPSFCVAPCCTPDCAGKVCGPDGCGGNCGTCPGALRCENGQCVSPCTPQTCPNGCCAADGTCQPGTAKGACGTDGAACQACGAGTGCIDQECEACKETTCEKENAVCGSLPDDCGGTLQCGTCPLGDTPSCEDGECRACDDVCSDLCAVCLQLPDGSTECASNSITFCQTACTSDADCFGEFPRCVVSGVDRASGTISFLPDECRKPGAVGICVGVLPCCTPDCAGKVCGSDGCVGSCGSCGPCQECVNGHCQTVGQVCGASCCEAGSTCCGGSCCAAGNTCCTDSGTPYCCQGSGSDFCGCCEGACCCP